MWSIHVAVVSLLAIVVTRGFFSFPAQDPNGTLASLNSFSSPPWRAKKIPSETFLDDDPG